MGNCKILIREISDADEPGVSVSHGMAHSDFDGAKLVLIPDGEPDDTDWYGTPRTEDGRPTRPVLLFYKGHIPTDEQALLYVESLIEEDYPKSDPRKPTELLDFGAPETLKTVPFHLDFPSYEAEAALGMDMGRFFTHWELVDWQDPSSEALGSFTFKFSTASHALRKPDSEGLDDWCLANNRRAVPNPRPSSLSISYHPSREARSY